MAQPSEIGPGALLRAITSHLNKYRSVLIIFTAIGFAITLFLSSSFEVKFAARGIFTANDGDLKSDFIFFRTLSDQYESDKNSKIRAIYANELILDNKERAIDIIIHLSEPSDKLLEEFNTLVISRNLNAEVPFMLNKKPILSKYSVLLAGGIISFLLAILGTIIIQAWKSAGADERIQ